MAHPVARDVLVSNQGGLRSAAMFCQPKPAPIRSVVPIGPHPRTTARQVLVNSLSATSTVESFSTEGVLEVTKLPSLLTVHPDAIRRRQEAEQRRQEAEEALKRATQVNWWEEGLTSNIKLVKSPEHFRELLATEAAGNKLVVVDFFAPWCRACISLNHKMKQLAANNPETLFLKVNGGDEGLRPMCESLGIVKLPYFHFYKDQQLKSHFAANLHKVSVLRAEIAALKS